VTAVLRPDVDHPQDRNAVWAWSDRYLTVDSDPYNT
jgi:hypothetical protein